MTRYLLPTLLFATAAATTAYADEPAQSDARRQPSAVVRLGEFMNGGSNEKLLSTEAYVDGLIASLEERGEKPEPISLRDAILNAVRSNPSSLAQRRIAESEAHGLIEAASVFEPVIAIDALYQRSKRPTADALAGVGEDDNTDPSAAVLESDRYEADFTISKVFRTGTAVEMLWENSRDTTNSRFQALSPDFEPSAGLRVSQPLLRDFGGVVANTNVRIADNTSLQAAAEFEESLSTFVADVVSAYWDYTLREAELAVRRRSHRLAAELAGEAEKRVEVGSLAPVAAQEARADAAAREEEVIAAEQLLSNTARRLQYLVMLGAEETGIPRAIRPSEEHGVAKIQTDRPGSLKTAVAQRAQVRAARLEVANAKLGEERARTSLLPSLDLVGSYELVGLGGIDQNRLVDERDAYGDSLEVLSSGDFFRYRIGLEFEVPLSNASARAAHTRSTIALKRSEEQLRARVADVALEVDSAAGNLEAAYKRVAAAHLARELAEENLRQQQRRYEVGLVTTTDILDFQENLADAMATEARAITDHAKAMTDYERSRGTLLESLGIAVTFDDRPDVPWWAKF